MARRRGEKDSDRFFKNNRPQYRSLTLLARAQEAIDYLIDRGGFVPYSKEQFAIALGWMDALHPEQPDRKLVETVCNLTRDQEDNPEVAEVISGFIIAYAPSQGGMTLVDPNGEEAFDGLVHVLIGDMQRQQAAMTVNRRRVPTWKTVGTRAANNDDHEMARLCWQAESEIDGTGFVQASTAGRLMKLCVARGFIE